MTNTSMMGLGIFSHEGIFIHVGWGGLSGVQVGSFSVPIKMLAINETKNFLIKHAPFPVRSVSSGTLPPVPSPGG